ncbi:MAG: AraC family transcriptional regulator, partial [Kiritimatiellae bacterium]|nr:AraC family transcriptional regulator [Kiritimatiellia bacterium]
LRDTSLTVEEVGSAIGFSSISYFSQAFKRQFGISPNAWRTRK